MPVLKMKNGEDFEYDYIVPLETALTNPLVSTVAVDEYQIDRDRFQFNVPPDERRFYSPDTYPKEGYVRVCPYWDITTDYPIDKKAYVTTFDVGARIAQITATFDRELTEVREQYAALGGKI